MSHILYLRDRHHATDFILHSKLGEFTELEYLNQDQAKLPCVMLTQDTLDIEFCVTSFKKSLIEYLDDYHENYGGLPMDFSYSTTGTDAELVFDYDHLVSFLTPDEFIGYVE